MSRDRAFAFVAVAALACALALAGCARRAGPPPIAADARCASCGMDAGNPRFACERLVGKAWRVYDSIECLLDDEAKTPGGEVYLADYDTRALHAADSLWVAKGSFPSPMGGGYAAFLSRAAADSIAAATRGRVGRFAEFAPGGGGRR